MSTDATVSKPREKTTGGDKFERVKRVKRATQYTGTLTSGSETLDVCQNKEGVSLTIQSNSELGSQTVASLSKDEVEYLIWLLQKGLNNGNK